MTHTIRASAMGLLAMLLAMLLTSGTALAQKTGTLLHQTDSTRKARRLLVENAPAEAAAKRDTIFAALVFDPSLAAPARSSAWTASVVRASPVTEARMQANLCDIAGAICGARGAASLMLAGPFNSGNEFTRLADLDGLFGSARVQGNYTSNATGAGTFYSFTGTFSEPRFAYRDSTTLGRRSVEHAAYAIEGGGGRRLHCAAGCDGSRRTARARPAMCAARRRSVRRERRPARTWYPARRGAGSERSRVSPERGASGARAPRA